ncbi:MAG: VCBS repeat-containing protein, partial [Bacteroidetes bacterium]|nr:VCBS repeat-containing protein [Bacteroidota bacterium]
NNDGLQDLYFTNNMIPNRLYLNKGDLRFEDITKSAGVDGQSGWCTGVTMVDVNSDGLLDIYVCRSFADPMPELRENLLYINNGDLTFTEKGADYGINDNGYATQATFFDSDNDGDLDLFIGNYPRHFETDYEVRFKKSKDTPSDESDKFYINNGNGTFTDVTYKAGLAGYGWCLGVVAQDIDMDGYVDLYVANDHAEPDMLYMNNGDGTFTNKINEAVKHMPNFSMGMDIGDYNNDNLPDIFVMDMMAEDNFRKKTQMSGMKPELFWYQERNGYHYQYMRNCLQLNNGNGSFSEIAQLAGISTTDWSWASLLADYDNDGWKDLFVCNGYRRNVRDNDYVLWAKERKKQVKQGSVPVSLDEIIKALEATKLHNYMFLNNGDLTFSEVSSENGMNQPSFSSGATYADLDNDGDLDIIATNMDDPPFIYRNNAESLGNNYLRIQLKGEGTNSMAFGTKVKITTDEGLQSHELTLTRGFHSSVENFLHFGLGKINVVNSVEVTWPDGRVSELENVQANQVLIVNQKESTTIDNSSKAVEPLFVDVTKELKIDFNHKENEFDDYAKEVLLPHRMSRFGPNVAVADVNGDGLDDFYIGGASGQTGRLYKQNKDGTFFTSPSQHFTADKLSEDIGAEFLDVDGDGDQDLLVVSGGSEFAPSSQVYTDRLYFNDGQGNFSNKQEMLRGLPVSSSCVATADFDKDGDIDAFVGGRLMPGQYPYPARSQILVNNSGTLVDLTNQVCSQVQMPGMVTSAVWVDIDNDDWLDLVIVGEWMKVTVLKNDKGVLYDISNEAGFDKTNGWWNKVVAADMDNDGDQDLILGNLGYNSKFQASIDEPFTVYSHDFDNNGTLDIVLGYYIQGVCVPVRGRQCSSEQIPTIKESFPSYNKFGRASLKEVYQQGLEIALHYEAYQLASCYAENQGDGTFILRPLHAQAQFSTVYAIITEDFNKDGHKDLLIAGNFWHPEVETIRNDASVGLLMTGNGKGQFEPVPVTESGFFAPLDVKDMEIMRNTADGSTLIFVANNNDALQIYRYKPPSILP